ncbi:alpha/beta hydrolase [Staphylococcus sp. IVB6246]|uniref:alpha/beta hydrolase n=1 Tax=Staphylococcus sp. IVB6246 TaxID=2989772 RepID=UPI0021D1CF4C|nr:alpha/beta hydrolase [Staphylococcus sp. IVB6246]UXR69704.1 alpha/beta hydrolase [Staphylococcus sp. IVB6246]
MKEIDIYNGNDYVLKGTFYESSHSRDQILIYFHGGGFIFGERDDLPKEYIEVITQYFHLLTVDYRLLPEANFNDILLDLHNIHDYVHEDFSEVYCMGRSAGGFLSLIYASQYDIQGIIDFYGFYDVQDQSFNKV